MMIVVGDCYNHTLIKDDPPSSMVLHHSMTETIMPMLGLKQ